MGASGRMSGPAGERILATGRQRARNAWLRHTLRDHLARVLSLVSKVPVYASRDAVIVPQSCSRRQKRNGMVRGMLMRVDTGPVLILRSSRGRLIMELLIDAKI